MLSKFQTSIILRDLKFTTIPKSNSIQLTCDLKTFDDQNVMSSDPKNQFLVKGKSNFYSTKNRNKELETVLNSFFFFFTKRFCMHQNHQNHQKHKDATKEKYKMLEANKNKKCA